mmetsp:Transcript_4067/g.10468  ORF Transcript_4067/g.10468 Transcript_4067/m.10468 type:complete len:237 (-) Transcript_4067:27-737(-)
MRLERGAPLVAGRLVAHHPGARHGVDVPLLPTRGVAVQDQLPDTLVLVVREVDLSAHRGVVLEPWPQHDALRRAHVGLQGRAAVARPTELARARDGHDGAAALPVHPDAVVTMVRDVHVVLLVDCEAVGEGHRCLVGDRACRAARGLVLHVPAVSLETVDAIPDQRLDGRAVALPRAVLAGGPCALHAHAVGAIPARPLQTAAGAGRAAALGLQREADGPQVLRPCAEQEEGQPGQ